ncbi:MAG TPA: tetratricopeptide repeat protein [Lacipirellulaceae bacterium]|nr:tetratricopeptide repeat protein [Lacipirellulaceae bacterium]
MRTNWMAAWALTCLAAGCAGTGSTAPGGFGAGGATSAFGMQQPQQPTWTQRVLGGTPADAQREAIAAARAAEAQRQAVDPLALSRGTGEPTPELYASMADMCCRSGNVPQARQLYQKALAMKPTHLDALLGAARMEDREGNLGAAIMLYSRAADAYPNNPTVLNDLGLCLAREGKLQDAERTLSRAVKLDPAKPLYRNNLAKVYVELNRLDAAGDQLAAVYPLPVVNYNLGVLLHQRGRDAESQRYLGAAIAMEPRMQPARDLLAAIRPSGPVYQTAQAPRLSVSPPAPTQAIPVTNVAPAAAVSPGSVSAGTGFEMPALLPPVN